MSEFNKSYRIKTEIGKDTHLHVKLEQKYDILELMSLKINQENFYKLHGSNYGVIAGRVLANDAFGIPNAKVSIFIPIENTDVNNILYTYTSVDTKDKNGVRYNLLPNEQLNNCHTNIGTFPEKQFLLDNDNVLEVYEKYYKYTTRTNNAGDYMIFGVPTGNHTLHVDLDLSDIGILSQKPRDMVYKGYNINQFENPNKFKYEKNLDSLAQVISQNNSVDVIPFWGDESENTIGITRSDINIHYKFEPTCVFMGSIVTDNKSGFISTKCIPSATMGAMDEITTSSGTIEMIRKTPNNDVEEFQIRGTQLIDGDGVWCYQIPMNLDYMITDEYGNMVPTNDPKKGIPTRTRVRFRISTQEFDNENSNTFPAKILVPNNPDFINTDGDVKIDYQFGSATSEESFKDLFWNGVYSVKSYIPRIQKGTNWKNEQFTGFKRVNYYGEKNPLPYNNIRISLPFMYQVICHLVHIIIWAISMINRALNYISILFKNMDANGNKLPASYISLSGSLCNEDLDYVCIIPGVSIDKLLKQGKGNKRDDLLGMAIANHYYELTGDLLYEELGFGDDLSTPHDSKSIHYQNRSSSTEKISNKSNNKEKSEATLTVSGVSVTDKTDYLIQCIEMNLAKQFKVIQFDFYNDWINGLIYIPRWMRQATKGFQFGDSKVSGKVYACNENFKQSRNIVQQCSLNYDKTNNSITDKVGCNNNVKKLKCHKSGTSIKSQSIFSQNGGIVKSVKTIKEQYVYYFKPYEKQTNNKNIRLFSTDIILLGTLNECDKWGIPNNLNQLVTSSYQMPPNLALTDKDIYGNEYEHNNESETGITMTFSFITGDTTNITDIYNIDLKNQPLSPVDGNGDYTVMSGIDWGYIGPMQSVKDKFYVDKKFDEKGFDNVTKLYRPGGHFLGLTCTNSETSIKTCVNLSRVCEYGVWMSQRQTYPNFDENGKIIETYSTVPLGIISKDEITGSNYRRYFATMNRNRLKTVINKNTGYPIYDFMYLNPTNFGGELNGKIFDKNSTNSESEKIKNGLFNLTENELLTPIKLFNRNIDKTIESEDNINDNHIMRIGEYRDDEYLNFRFGTNNISNCFLINSRDTQSFPVYDNSYYFYFGLRDGKTALDKFKENYYANCGKTNLIEPLSTYVNVINLEVHDSGITDGNCNNDFAPIPNSGSISFSLDISDDLNINNVVATLKKEGTDNINNFSYNSDNNKFNCSLLSIGDYIVNISIGDIIKTFNVYIGQVNLSCELEKVDFYIDTSGIIPDNVFKLHRRLYGGAIIIPNNSVIYTDSGNETEYNVFNLDEKNQINSIEIKFNQHERIVCENTNSESPVFYYYKSRFDYNPSEVSALIDNNRNYLIPVPYSDCNYDVYVNTKLSLTGKLSENGNCTYSWYLGNVTINNGKAVSFIYNNNSYEILKNYIPTNEITGDTTEGWWIPKGESNWLTENELFQWNLKKGLYQNSLETPHRVSIVNINGTPPYVETVEGVKEDLITTAVTRSDFEYVKIPTINYLKNGKKRKNFSYKVQDSKGMMTNKFIFPVIYKPFFMEMILWYINEQNKTYLQGNIYNGITWDYKEEGFNNVILNNVNIKNFATIDKDDTTMEIDEVFTTDKGGYSYTGKHFKYNGRKVSVCRELTSDLYGLHKNNPIYNFDLSIGSLHEGYEDKTQLIIDKTNIIDFKFVGKVIDGKYNVKMEPLISDNNSNYTLVCLRNDYIPYPLKNNNLNYEPMFEKLIRGNFKDYNDQYKNDYIEVSSITNKNAKVYYIAYNSNIVEKNGLKINSSTNENNKIGVVSVSELLDLYKLSSAYTFSMISATLDKQELLLILEFDMNEGDFKDKLISLSFYNNKNKDYVLTLDGNEMDRSVRLDLKDYSEILYIGNKDSLSFDYEIYNNKTNERYLYTDNFAEIK